MLRSVLIARLAAESGLSDAAAIQPLVIAYQQARTEQRFEDWAVHNGDLTPDAAEQFRTLFENSMFECMGCSNLISGADTTGDVDARCSRCGSTALKIRVTGRPDRTSQSQSQSGARVPRSPAPPAAGGSARSDRMQRSGATQNRTPSQSGHPGGADSGVGNESTAHTGTPRTPIPSTTRISGGPRSPSGTTKMTPGPTPMEGKDGKDPPRIGNWQLLGLIGSGGSGRVFKAYHPVLDRYAAIKVLTACHEKLRHRFYYEARILARLVHPAIVQILDFGEHTNIPYFVMEWVEGPSLRQLVTRLGPRPLSESVHIAIDVCGGLAVAHDNGVIHRDIKPANVLVGADGVKLTDFGLAVSDDMNVRLTQPGTVLGTPAYMAPEQVTGDDVTTATDIYSLGAMLYNMVTGAQPFRGEQQTQVMAARLNERFPLARDLNPDLPPELDELLQWMCARRQKDRPQDIRVVAGTLDEVLLAVDRRAQTRTLRNVQRTPTVRPQPGQAGSQVSLPNLPAHGSRQTPAATSSFLEIPPLPPPGAITGGPYRTMPPPPPPPPQGLGQEPTDWSRGWDDQPASSSGPVPLSPANPVTRVSADAADTGDLPGVSEAVHVDVDLVQVTGTMGQAEWQRLLDQIGDSSHTGVSIPVVVDLSQCDAVTTSVIRQLQLQATELGERVILADVPDRVRIAMDLVGLPAQMPFEPTVEDAVKRAGGGIVRKTRYRSF